MVAFSINSKEGVMIMGFIECIVDAFITPGNQKFTRRGEDARQDAATLFTCCRRGLSEKPGG